MTPKQITKRVLTYILARNKRPIAEIRKNEVAELSVMMMEAYQAGAAAERERIIRELSKER